LVLGSVHLSELHGDLNPESLKPLLEKLAAYKPDVITVEQLSGESCDMMARHPAIYDPKDVSRFCGDSSVAKAATGLDIPAAIAEVNKTLKNWPAQPSAGQRRHLTALFLAANDDTSAMVQWWQLPAGERRAGDGLDETLVALMLKRESDKKNESYRIAARLAAQLGLQRVYAVDDHTGDSLDASNDVAYWKSIQHAWDSAAAQRQPVEKQVSALEKSGEMLAAYRRINDPAARRILADGDFGAALRDQSPQRFGQMYVAGWETRNLRMAANVRAAFAERPGARVLAIVGAMHKPWFDSFLGQMQGVDIVDTEQVLR
jgi:hypothetical protein